MKGLTTRLQGERSSGCDGNFHRIFQRRRRRGEGHGRLHLARLQLGQRLAVQVQRGAVQLVPALLQLQHVDVHLVVARTHLLCAHPDLLQLRFGGLDGRLVGVEAQRAHHLAVRGRRRTERFGVLCKDVGVGGELRTEKTRDTRR